MKPGASLSDENWKALVETQANAILYAVQDLRPEDKGYFVNLLKDQYAFLTVEGNEYAYNQQTGLAEGELIRRTVDEYVRKNGKCSAEGDCARELDRARGELMAQLLRATDSKWEERGNTNSTFAHNQAAADHLSDVAGYIGALVDTTYGQKGGSDAPYSFLFTASDLEKNNHAAKGSLVFAMRDLYNAMPLEQRKEYKLWSMVAYQDVFADEGNMRGLGREQYLDTLAASGAELQLLHMAMQVAYQQLQGPLSSQEEYDRASRIYYGYKNVSALLQTYIVDDVTRARLATVLGQGQQLTFDDINLLKDIDKKTTHPGILVARHAIGGSLSEALLNLSLMRMARGWKVMASGGTGSTLDDLARVNEQKLLENQNKPIGLLPPPGKKGVETKTIYVDSEGNASVGKLPPERGGKTYYVDPEGRIYTSLDYIKVNVKAPAADKLAERIGGVYSYLLNECYDHPVISNDEP